MHKQFKWAIVVQKEGVECRLGTKKIEKKNPHVCKSECGVVLKFSLKSSIFAMSRNSYTVGGNADWYSHYGKQCGDFL